MMKKATGERQNSKCKVQNAKLFAGLIVFILVMFAHNSVSAALTKQLSYQGRLNNASGQPVPNGTYSIVFSIYNVASGGAPLWTEMQNVVVEGGGFSAYLGSVTPLNLLFNEDYFLGIKVGSDPEMTPRMKLAVVGTAAFALESDKLQGKAASDFALSTHTHTVTVGTSEITDGSITAVDIDAAAVQKRVTGTCAGQVMVAVNQDGTVTCEADDTGGGGGSSLTPASTVQPVTSASVVGTSTNYAREDHQHNIASNFITDSMISSSAAISASKISGLGSLATMNAVSGTEIQDATITFADIASNSCLSGQIAEYNGSAWVCGTDDTTGGGAVVNNPGSTQTIIAGNSSTTPLALKAASAPTAAMFDVLDFSGGSVVKVAPSGNLLVGNPAQIAPKLSVEDTSINPGIAVQQKGTGAALDVWQSGTSGSAGVFSITNAGNTSDLISGDLSGTGSLLKLSLSGVNKFVVDKVGNVTATSFSGSGSSLTGVSASDPNAVNLSPSGLQTLQATVDIVPLVIKDDVVATTADLFDIQSSASTSLVRVNSSGNLLVGSPTVTAAKVSAEETGTANKAGAFEIMNVSNANSALLANTTGTGNAGEFGISNGSNASAVLVGDTSGTGNLLQLTKSGVNKFVVDNTGAITVGGVSNVVKTNPSAAQTIAPTADATALVLKPGTAAPTLDIFGINNFADVNLLKVSPAGNLLVGNPASTSAKVSVEQTGTTNYAGYFKINNVSNGQQAIYVSTTGTGDALYAYTTGTGNAGNFDISNVSNSNSAVYAYTNGTGSVIRGNSAGAGNLLQLQQTGVDKFVVNNAGNITTVGTALVTGLNADKVDGYDATSFAQLASMNTATTAVALMQLNQNGGAGGLLQLQYSGVDKVVVNNSGNVLVGNPTLTNAKVSAEETGTANYAGYFQVTNASNIYAAVRGYTYGTGIAGQFEINNATNSSPSIWGNTTGTGSLLQLQQGGADKFVVGNTGEVTITKSGTSLLDIKDAANTTLNITNSLAGTASLQVEGTNVCLQSGTNCPAAGGSVVLSPSAAQTIQPTADVVPLIIKDDALAVADLFDVQNNVATSLVKINPTGNLLVGNPLTTTAKVSAKELGTANYAGYFETNNTSNAVPALYVLSNANSYAGAVILNNSTNAGDFWSAFNAESQGLYDGAAEFVISNASNAAPLITGNMSGTGSMLIFQKSGVPQLTVANNGKITFSTGANKAVGVGTVAAATACLTVANTSVTASSIILITINSANTGTDVEALKIKNIVNGTSFDVCTVKESVGHTLGISFNYMIMN